MTLENRNGRSRVEENENDARHRRIGIVSWKAIEFNGLVLCIYAYQKIESSSNIFCVWNE